MMFILLISALLAYFFYKQHATRSQLPPGPFPFLFLGNFPQLFIGVLQRGSMVNAMKQWKKTYGDVFTFWMGPDPNVYLSTIETSREVMINQGTYQIDRESPYAFRMMASDENGDPHKGVAFTNGEHWSEHRRFALTTLRNFGMGRNIMEEKIMEEFDFQFAEIEKGMVNGKCVVKTDEMCDLLIGSIINRFLFGYRFDADTKARFFGVKHGMDEIIDKFTPIDMAMKPWWKNIPVLSSRHHVMIAPQEKLDEFVRENVERRRHDISTGNYVLDRENGGNDYIDSYLIEQEKRQEKGESVGNMDDWGLIADLTDLWGAGQETTTTTMRWGIHLLLQHPEVTEKCRKELLDATNGSRTISLADRSSTPFMIATINEIQRHASILTFNLNRQTTEVTKVTGYSIPKGTPITAQLSLILSDENVFKNPDEFNPSRYMGPKGKELEQCTIPFGIGKRACIGEGLARAELYLLLSNIILRYSLSIDPAHPPSGVCSRFGVSHRPKSFNVYLERNEL